MFTGIVEELGTIFQIQETNSGKRITIVANDIMDDLKVGDNLVSKMQISLLVRDGVVESINQD